MSSIIEKMTADNKFNLEDNVASTKKRLLGLRAKELQIATDINSFLRKIEDLKAEKNQLAGRIAEVETFYNFLDEAAQEWGIRNVAISTKPSDVPAGEPVAAKKVTRGTIVRDRIAKNLCTKFNEDTHKYCNRKTTTKAQKAAKLCKVCLATYGK